MQLKIQEFQINERTDLKCHTGKKSLNTYIPEQSPIILCVCSGTDEDTIINIITNRSNAQRQEIRHVFKSLLGRVSRPPLPPHCSVTALIWPEVLIVLSGSLQDLMADLKSELSKNLCRLIMGLMMTPAEFDAKMMKKAMEVRQNHHVMHFQIEQRTQTLYWVEIESFGTPNFPYVFCTPFYQPLANRSSIHQWTKLYWSKYQS